MDKTGLRVCSGKTCSKKGTLKSLCLISLQFDSLLNYVQTDIAASVEILCLLNSFVIHIKVSV